MAPAANAFEQEELQFIGGYIPTGNYCVGVINISKLESIQYTKEPDGSYHITISYIGSSLDSDATLTLSSSAGNALRDNYGNDQAIEHAIQKLISSMVTAMQKSYTSSHSNVVEYYPQFDLGDVSLRSTFSPYTADNAASPQDELLKQVQALLSGALFG